jgi:hemin uptake protein HemP
VNSLPEENPAQHSEKPPPGPEAIDSQSLLRGKKIAIIRHNGEEYRLILTRNDRLILQK